MPQADSQSGKRSSEEVDASAQADEKSAQGVDRRKKLAEVTDDVLEELDEALFGEDAQKMSEAEKDAYADALSRGFIQKGGQ